MEAAPVSRAAPIPRAEAVPVRLTEVSKRFGGVVAVDRLTLEIPAGRLVTLLGPSGCGKTTTLRMIAGLEIPTEGRIFIGAEDVTRLSAALRRITMVFQSYALFPHLTVFENVAYGLRIARVPESELRRRVDGVLEMVGLPGVGARYPAQLSGGQQQRVALARALVMEPRVLLFDEPLSNLDAKLRKRVRGEIRELQQRLGITSVYVTHDQAEALALSDVVVVIHQGRVEQIGSPQELYLRPASRFVADFIGEANLVDATYQHGEVRVAGRVFPYGQPGIGEGECTLVIRPDAIRVRRAGDGLPGVVRTAAFMGSNIEYLLDTDAGTLLAVQPPGSEGPHAPGSRVSLQLDPVGLYLLPG